MKKIGGQSLAAVVKAEGIAMFVMRWRGLRLDVATDCVSVHEPYRPLSRL